MSDLEWRTSRAQGGGTLEHDYLLRVSGDVRAIFVIFGISAAGGMVKRRVLLNAQVIDARHLVYYPLSEAIGNGMATLPPSTWGLS